MPAKANSEPVRNSLAEPRPISPEFLENHNRQASGMPPAGAVSVPVMPDVPGSALKPSIHVANAAIGREIGTLKLRLQHAERAFEHESSKPLPVPGPYSPVEYFISQRQGMTGGIASLKAEIQRLESLSPAETIDWAYARGWS